jgi:parallel beta-helix repeat protein
MEDAIRSSCLTSLALLFAPMTTQAAVVEVTPSSDVRAAIAALKPGDELVLRGGTYTYNTRFAISVVGTAAEPITIGGKDGEGAIIDMTTDQHNVIEIDGSSYLVLRNLKITHGSHGIRLIQSSHVTIEDNEIYETGDVGISANSGGTCEGLLIRRNHIHHTNGTGEGGRQSNESDRRAQHRRRRQH